MAITDGSGSLGFSPVVLLPWGEREVGDEVVVVAERLAAADRVAG
jgi:hypothetical protein